MTTEGVSVSHLTWCTSSATPMDISVRLILYISLNKYSFNPLTNTLQGFLKIQHKSFDRYRILGCKYEYMQILEQIANVNKIASDFFSESSCTVLLMHNVVRALQAQNILK